MSQQQPRINLDTLSRAEARDPMAEFAPMAAFWLALVLAIALLPANASAASLRCDKAILSEGAHMYEVSELCGEPVAEFSRLEQLHPDVVVYVDEWVYRLGNNRFQRMLRFENGRLQSIRTLRKPRPEPYTGRGAQPAAAEYRISY